MVANGIRGSKVPTYEQETDFLSIIAPTMVFGFLLIVPILIIGLIFPQVFESTIPVINATVGQYVVILWVLCLWWIGVFVTKHEREKYLDMKRRADELDEEEYAKFVELVMGRAK